MKKTYIDECLERANAAYPGPWEWIIDNKSHSTTLNSNYKDDPYFASIDESLILDDGSSNGEYQPVIDSDSPNGIFIKHSRTDVPELCMRLKLAIEAIKQSIARADDCGDSYNSRPIRDVLVKLEAPLEGEK